MTAVESARRLMRGRNVRTLFAARLISNLGNGISPIALAFGVLGLPGATATSLSIVMFCQMLPIVGLMLIGGVIADRFPRALLIGTTDMVLSILVVGNGVMLLTHTATVTSMAIIALASGTLNAAWWPAMMGLMPELVEEEELQQANSIIGLAVNAASVIGAMVGGVLVAAVGSGTAIVIDGLTFLVAGILVFTLRGTGTRRDSGEGSPSVFDDLVHGWREFTRLKWVVVIVAGYSILAMMFESLIAVLGPVRAKEALGGPRPWSYILAAWSAGMLIGVAAMLRIHLKRPLVTALLWQLGMGMWYFAMGLSTNLWLIAAVAFLCGIGSDVMMVTWATALQQNIPRESLSRVSSYDAFGSLLFTPLGLLIAGPIAERIGVTQTLLTFGLMFLIVLAAMLSFREVRDLPPLTSALAGSDDEAQ